MSASADLLGLQATPASAIPSVVPPPAGHGGSLGQGGHTSKRAREKTVLFSVAVWTLPLKISFVCHKFSVVLHRGRW